MAIRELVETFVRRARVPIAVTQDPGRFRPNDTPVLVGSHQRLTADTGWSPEIPLDRTVDDLLDHWRNRVAEG
jgi:GDP-4-dehydro-6-deoxy-D-mannose reductase